MSSTVERVLNMIKQMSVADFMELRRRLEADPRWPAAGAPVGAKPLPSPPSLSAAAERKEDD